jgi:hypothetical protein
MYFTLDSELDVILMNKQLKKYQTLTCCGHMTMYKFTVTVTVTWCGLLTWEQGRLPLSSAS